MNRSRGINRHGLVQQGSLRRTVVRLRIEGFHHLFSYSSAAGSRNYGFQFAVIPHINIHGLEQGSSREAMLATLIPRVA
ncbi:MAG: hypothetical protein WCH39_00930 [Schlesneria sp.]